MSTSAGSQDSYLNNQFLLFNSLFVFLPHNPLLSLHFNHTQQIEFNQYILINSNKTIKRNLPITEIKVFNSPPVNSGVDKPNKGLTGPLTVHEQFKKLTNKTN